MTMLGRHTVELMDEGGAMALADKIRQYWRARGHDPIVTVEKHSIAPGKNGRPTPTEPNGAPLSPRAIWVVRSNIGQTLARAA